MNAKAIKPGMAASQVNESDLVLIRWPFRILAGILAFGVFVPLLVHIVLTDSSTWLLAVLMGYFNLQLGSLALTGKRWPRFKWL